ncbi:MAG TPA: GGDEF domain-containing protein [Deltaproteobacteria bacterium]|nr:GGDEF domain-containing protein [Deltaproteobacteria bacterium]
MNAVLSSLLPGGVVLCAALFLVNIPCIQDNIGDIAGVYPYAAYLFSMAFGWRFNRSVLAFGAVCMALTHWCLLHFGALHHGSDLYWRIAYVSASLLLPLNLLALSLFKERGIFTPRGLFRLVVILGQPVAAGIIAARDPQRFLEVLEGNIVETPWLDGLPVPQIPSAVCLGCLIVLAWLFMRNRGAKEGGFFWAVCAVFAAMAEAPDLDVAAFHLATAAFILLISIIEVSHAMAFRDELTGLPARRALREELLKLGSEYCLAMLDIDHFKKFNDRHGHDVGDQVLRMVATRLARVGGGGRSFRYGGEEFTVIFPGRYAEDALEHLEELRKEVASSGFVIRSPMRPRRRPKDPRRRPNGPKTVSVTISIGAAWPDGSTRTADAVLKAADRALYRAKKKGRNRVST